MAFIHVEPREIAVAQRSQHAHAADAENHFLAKAIVGITSIERAGEVAVNLRVRGQVGVQEVHRHLESVNTLHGVTPASQLEAAILDGNAGAGRFLGQKVFDAPGDGFLGL